MKWSQLSWILSKPFIHKIFIYSLSTPKKKDNTAINEIKFQQGTFYITSHKFGFVRRTVSLIVGHNLAIKRNASILGHMIKNKV